MQEFEYAFARGLNRFVLSIVLMTKNLGANQLDNCSDAEHGGGYLVHGVPVVARTAPFEAGAESPVATKCQVWGAEVMDTP